MRVPLSWLREFVPVAEDASAEDLMATLVKVGLEEEDVHRPTDEMSGPIVVGQVLSMEPETHSNGKTVNWCQVRVVPEGREQTLTGKGIEPSGVQGIICGAHNFKPGDKVVVTLPGAVLPGGFAITARKTYGHKSAGMIASTRELGIGDDHGGILVLSTLGLDPELGTDAMELLGLYDQAAEVNVTPDRGYAFSLRGIAREWSHATGTPFEDFVLAYGERAPEANSSGHPVALRDDAPIHGNPGCVRFVMREVSGVKAETPVPTWMSSRLRLAGVRSLSLPVDISNYVMLETGQPLHFYDADKVQGEIVVRRAVAGEKLVTLDGVERTLHPEDIVIADDSGVIGLAGVMGGASTEVTDSTTRILIEAARFDEVSVARTARRHKLISEASKRFERGVDPQIQAAAAQRAVELLVELAGAQAEPGVTDVSLGYEPVVIELPAEYTAGRGYTPEQAGKRRALNALAAAGLTEVFAYPFVSAEANNLWSAPWVSTPENPVTEVPSIRLENPISSAEGWMRRSLLPGLVEVLKRNLSRGFKNLAIFESGHVFIPGEKLGSDSIPPLGVRPSDEVLADLNAGIPKQPSFIAGLFAGTEHEVMPGAAPRAYDWRDALDAVRLIADAVSAPITVRNGVHTAFHPGRVAEVLDANGERIGFAGELHPKLLQELNLPERTCAFELDFSALFAHRVEVHQAVPVLTYPAATQDVALLVDRDLPASEVERVLREGAGELLEDIRVFDDYRGTGIDESKKSLAFALRFRAPDRTLTADEASAAREAAVTAAVEQLGAEARV